MKARDAGATGTFTRDMPVLLVITFLCTVR